MPRAKSTCWTVIEGAAAGCREDREHFARRYAPVVRAYLAARWRTSACQEFIDDAVQEVFLDCFKQGGVLERADRKSAGGFRAFLYGVARVTALRVETRWARERERQSPSGIDLENVEVSEDSLSKVFDRAWAKALFREAADLHAERARESGEPARRRVELLRLRFHDGLPIREIAERWQIDVALLHHEYAKARQEFKEALLEVMAFHHPGSSAELEQECADLAALWQ